MEPAIVFDNISKKFSKGYVSDSFRNALINPFRDIFSNDVEFSLRDALINPFRNAFGGNNEDFTSDDKKRFWALKDICFEVMPGEALGIIGSNGSGKSTTLKLLSRILRPTKGQISVKGRIGALIELAAGFVPDLTGRENVFLNGAIFGMTREEVNNRYEQIVEFAEIEDFMDTPMKWYSTGMKARLGFAMAANINPDVLLIDEVLSVGDTWFQKKCLDKMQEFRDRGTTIVFVSHNMESVASLCDRVAVINKGNLSFIGNTAEAIIHYLGIRQDDSQQDSKKVVIKETTLLDSNRNSRFNFKSGESVFVELKVKALENTDDMNIGLFVTDKNSTRISLVQYRSLSGKKTKLKKNETINIVFKLSLNINSGVYNLIAKVHDEKSDIEVTSINVAKFIIEEITNSEGIAYLNASIENISITNEDKV